MTEHTRRAVLGAGAGAVSLAGCLGLGAGASAEPDELDRTARPTLGSADASLRVVAFEDFSCPGCRTFHTSVLPAVVSQYVRSGAVEYYHADYPIPVDRWSYRVASAARAVFEAAGDEAFFTFVGEIYGRSGPYTLELLETAAESAAEAGAAARTAADGETYRDTLDADKELAEDWGIDTTPSVFVEQERVDAGELLDVLADSV